MPKKHGLALHFAPRDFQAKLLAWYDAFRRELPWRASPGVTPDPYRVWLSEIMLQQTTVKAVIPYFEAFLKRCPSAGALAAAPRDEVLAAWAGLGYYSRARNLHACAQAIAQGGFPRDEARLRQLPGIGAYTAAAIAAIAFDQPAAAVDGNVERVLSRVFALETPLPAAKPLIRGYAIQLVPRERPGDYAQAMMDLGATVCSPRAPACGSCPVKVFCSATVQGEPARFPARAAKSGRPIRRGDAFIIVRTFEDGPHVLLRRRPDKGLLGGMMEVPCYGWDLAAAPHNTDAPASARWIEAAPVKHTFTHFQLEMRVYAAAAVQGQEADDARDFGGEWAALPGLPQYALPSIMRKAVAAGLEALGIDTPDAYAAGRAASSASKVAAVEPSARPSIRAGRK